ncbi:MAG: prohibitin family protein [Paludibacteraceae bacterium]|nr:prohibitin family protein [Paludibacteraceae bacterium]
MSNKNFQLKNPKAPLYVLIAVLVLICFFGSFYTIDTQDRGVVSTFGKIDPEPVGDGLHMKIPFVQKVKKMSIQVQKVQVQTESYTRDMQNASIVYALNYSLAPDAVAQVYARVGKNYEKTIIEPVVLGKLKDVIGTYDAASMVGNRDEVRKAAETAITEELRALGYFENITIQIINIDYDDAYEKSIVEKQVAEQKALTAKNNTVRIEEEANQQVIAAKAEAEAIRIKAQAMASNPKIVEYEAVLKWDGHLPTYNGGGALPFINIGK